MTLLSCVVICIICEQYNNTLAIWSESVFVNLISLPSVHKEKPNLTKKINNNYTLEKEGRSGGCIRMKFERGEIVQKNNY